MSPSDKSKQLKNSGSTQSGCRSTILAPNVRSWPPHSLLPALSPPEQRVRIGLAVQVLPLTNPLRPAEEAATVDHISKGRFDFGIGRSGLTRYYQGYNVPYTESRGRFLEALDIITQAWKQEQFSYTGDHFNFSDVTVVPRPYQQPHPPIRVALASPETF